MTAAERDFFAEPLTPGELESLVARAGGIRSVFAFSSPSFRKLGRPPETFADEDLFELVLAEPRLLRRPLIVTDDGRVLTGAKAPDEL